MLIESLTQSERLALNAAVVTGDDGPVRDIINRIAWARILDRWDRVIWRFWIFKTFRYRDLRPVWEILFGPMPAVPR